jgi:hypothetical protein
MMLLIVQRGRMESATQKVCMEPAECVGPMLEDALNTLALAIESLADAITREKRTPAPITIVKHDQARTARCMDAAGVPTTFKRQCSICGESGRNARSHKDEMRDGTHHWVEVKQ